MTTSVRDQIRVAFLAAKPSTEIVRVAGVEVEIRSPSVQVVLGNNFDRKTALAYMLINYCYVPGTNEHVFDDADVESLMAMPFNSEISKLIDKINKLTDVGDTIENEGKGSGANLGAEASSNLH